MADSNPLAVSPLNLNTRRVRDIGFGCAYVLLFVATIAIAVRSAATARNNLAEIATECSNTTVTSRANRVGAALGDDSTLIPDIYSAIRYLGLALLLSILLGCVWMAALKTCARQIIYTTLIAIGVSQIAMGIYLASVYNSNGPYVFCLCGALYFTWLCCARSRIELTAQLLQQAVLVVADHPGLVGVSAGLLLVKLLVLGCGAGAIALLFASQLTITKTGPGSCEFDWRARTADELMYAALLLFTLWSATLWLWLRFYVVSLTTGVWYYERQSLAAQDGLLSTKDLNRAPVSTALRLALTKGFGTCAFASLVVTVCEWLKALVRQQADRDGNLITCLIACCITCLINALEFLTRFALTFSALTGDGLCAAGTGFYGTCRRHGFLKVVVIDYLASMTLQFGALIFGLVVAALTITFVRALGSYSSDRDVLIAVGTASWVLATLVLTFISSLLLNVIDASYACIVLDLDGRERTQTFHRPAIAHAVLAKVKPEYVVIAQPDGAAACAHSHVAVPIASAVPVGRAAYGARP